MLDTILLFVFVFIFGGVVGALAAILYLDKSMTGLIDSFNDLIAALWGIIRQTHRTLIALRDAGSENLDETIGCLGAYLDAQDKEEVSNG